MCVPLYAGGRGTWFLRGRVATSERERERESRGWLGCLMVCLFSVG